MLKRCVRGGVLGVCLAEKELSPRVCLPPCRRVHARVFRAGRWGGREQRCEAGRRARRRENAGWKTRQKLREGSVERRRLEIVAC